MSKTPKNGRQIICENRRARREYEFSDTIEAGIVLVGSEVKSLREGRASLSDAYARIENGEAFLFNAHIDEYAPASRLNHDPKRKRKLLLHRYEIERLGSKTKEKGLSLIPLSMYFKDGLAKVELGLGRGKREFEKDETQKERQISRDIARQVRSRELMKRRG